MKYLTEERFIVHSSDPGAQKRYAEGWERTFGDGPEERKDPDEITMTFKISQLEPVAGCPDCTAGPNGAICVGTAGCPYIRNAGYRVVDKEPCKGCGFVHTGGDCPRL